MSKAKAFGYDVFLSHSSRDNLRVERLARRLQLDGFRVWLDLWEIKGGDEIFSKIQQGVEQSRCLVLAVSKAALASDWVRLEHHTALFRDPLNKERRFVPVLIDACYDRVPDTLRQYRHVDLRRFTTKAFRELLVALSDHGEQPPFQPERGLPAIMG